MNPEIFLSNLSPEEIEEASKNEQLYWDNKTQTKYFIAVDGSKTMNGGVVKAEDTQCFIGGKAIARVGDEVIYEDGSSSKIISGAGVVCTIEDIPIAIVGSQLENGDQISESPNNEVLIRIFKDEPIPKGFLNLN